MLYLYYRVSHCYLTLCHSKLTFKKMANKITISNSDRERIVNSYENQMSITKISRIFNIKRTTVHEIVKKFLKTGESVAEKRGGSRNSKLNETHKEFIRNEVNEDCTISLSKLKSKVHDKYGITISISTVGRVLDDFNYSLKRIHLIPERKNIESTIIERRNYAIKSSSLRASFSEDQIIFIDEVGLNVSLRVTRGRSPIGVPACCRIPCIRSRNILYKSQTRAYNKELFIEFILELKIKLRDMGITTAIFIMDNVRFHKSIEVQAAIEDENYQILYLPPYSPFLNPIENMFRKWKEITKRTNPTNEVLLMSLIEAGSQLVTYMDCEGYFRKMWSYMPKCLNKDEILN